MTLPRPQPATMPLSLPEAAAGLAQSWRSSPFAAIAGTRLKVLRMDARAYPAEIHDHDEALLVLDGRMLLEVEGRAVPVAAGELYLVAAGMRHGVAAGSHGTLLVVDPLPQDRGEPGAR